MVRRKSLAEKIRSQVECQLYCERLSADRYLHVVIWDHDGWVPISTLLAYPSMRKLCFPQVMAVAHVLSTSKRLQLSPDLRCVRPSQAPCASPARAGTRTVHPGFKLPIAQRPWSPLPSSTSTLRVATSPLLAHGGGGEEQAAGGIQDTGYMSRLPAPPPAALLPPGSRHPTTPPTSPS